MQVKYRTLKNYYFLQIFMASYCNTILSHFLILSTRQAAVLRWYEFNVD